MKKLLLLIIFSAGIATAQIKVKINGKPVAENTVVKIEDIKTFDVAFDKPKKLSYIGTGRAILGVALLSNDGSQLIEEYVIKKNGTNAVESFLADVNVYLNVIPDASGEKVFTPRVLNNSFHNMLAMDDDEMVRVEINLMFFDKVGYEKYGDPIPLVKKFVFMIDNKTNATAYAAAQQEKKAKLDAEKAEREKSNAAAQKEADSKKKKKGLLNSVLNKI